MPEQRNDLASFGNSYKNGGVMGFKTVKGLLQQTQRIKTYTFDGVMGDAIGSPEVNGMWLVYGSEKQGKTWFSLKLADYFTRFTTVLYVSGEQGFDTAFGDTVKQLNIDVENPKLKFSEYIAIEELDKELEKQRSARVILIDNVSVYVDELKGNRYMDLVKAHPNKLFIFIAHEKDGKPFLATAQAIKRFSKIIVHVEGLACHVSGRCKGGVLMIDEEKARLFHGDSLINKNKTK